jgi:hypothetical protein
MTMLGGGIKGLGLIIMSDNFMLKLVGGRVIDELFEEMMWVRENIEESNYIDENAVDEGGEGFIAHVTKGTQEVGSSFADYHWVEREHEGKHDHLELHWI